MNNILLVNITWNPHGWSKSYQDSRAGHAFAKVAEGGESLNFSFKRGIDSAHYIHGYFKWTQAPTKFEPGGLIIFFSQNLDKKKGQLVGIYGGATLRGDIEECFAEHYSLRAIRKMSLLFPLPLDADHYKIPGLTGPQSRLVPQCGFTYKTVDFVARVLQDEVAALEDAGNFATEIVLLKQVYEHYVSKHFPATRESNDEREQRELSILFQRKTKKQLLTELLNISLTDPEEIIIKSKTYRRDNKTVAQIKLLRGSACQFCGWNMKKANGMAYIEAAHIDPKRMKGGETLHNLLLLCPNHHKEFDLGKREILARTNEYIRLLLNDIEYIVRFDGSM